MNRNDAFDDWAAFEAAVDEVVRQATEPICRDDEGVAYDDHDWSEWNDRPEGAGPASKPHYATALRWCHRCNRYEAKRKGGIGSHA